ncbi:MAG: histidinol dehydrogenase [Clostridia bacterium]|nr:histidinol dehydrogenase [Clostridia bacterium]MDR3644561.1 histidinol dehydrogenase [Clostridia bacterium]
MKLVTADGKNDLELLRAIRSRGGENTARATEAVQKIIDDVRLRGDDAVREYTLRFDGVAPETFEVSKSAIEAAYRAAPRDFIVSLERAAANIRDFHERQRQQSWLETKENGVILGQRIRGLTRVGVYVPGGTAAYPSSVLMNVIPAKVAGVREIVMVTPPTRSGAVNPAILAAARVAGVDRIFAVGGAQAVAALAFGTRQIPKADKIVGPGNIYVATAKRLVFGTVDIDMIAGPSEILIIADETAEPAFLAADLMSQAEHDAMASAILVTTSRRVAEATVAELDRQVSKLSRADIIRRSLEDFGAAIVCGGIEQAVRTANELAPEHLELMVENPMELLGEIDNAGSVFLGRYAPEPLGDYFAGPNHVLPTGGTARFFSPLSVDSFIKKSSFIYYTQAALADAKDDITTLARAEGLTAHAHSIEIRFEGRENCK